jgi:hypothetical protein
LSALVLFASTIAVVKKEFDDYDEYRSGSTPFWLVAISVFALPAIVALLVSLPTGGEAFGAAFHAKPYLDAGLLGWQGCSYL